MQPMPEPQPVQVGPTLAEWNERFEVNLADAPSLLPAERTDWAFRRTTEQLGSRPPAHLSPAEHVPGGEAPKLEPKPDFERGPYEDD